MATFKVGDMVVRTDGGWRGVSEGDINKVSAVHGNSIELEGYTDITFDADNFMLHKRAPVEALKVGDRVEFISESGEGDSKAVKGEHGTIKVLDRIDGLANVAMDSGVTIDVLLWRLRKLSFEVNHLVTGMPARLIQINVPGVFKVGARVMLATASPEYGRGDVDMSEVGTVTQVGSGESGYALDEGDLLVEFPSDGDWIGVPEDLKHANTQVGLPKAPVPLVFVSTPEIPLDEAVKGCQDIRQQIAELTAKAKVFEEVMRKAGIKFI